MSCAPHSSLLRECCSWTGIGKRHISTKTQVVVVGLASWRLSSYFLEFMSYLKMERERDAGSRDSLTAQSVALGDATRRLDLREPVICFGSDYITDEMVFGGEANDGARRWMDYGYEAIWLTITLAKRRNTCPTARPVDGRPAIFPQCSGAPFDATRAPIARSTVSCHGYVRL